MELAPFETIVLCAVGLSVGWLLWGIVDGPRGAGIGGALFGLVLARLVDHPSPLLLAAFGAIGFSTGGALAYLQNLRRVDRSPTAADFGWGMFGLTLKGVLWVGNGGLWLGIGSGFRAYSAGELIALIAAQFLLGLLGGRLLNRPHRPPEEMPRLYFSDSQDEIPEREHWGALGVGYLLLLVYVVAVKRDWFALGLSVFGAAGGLGFPVGKSLQSWGALLVPTSLREWLDWDQIMRGSFGAVAGAVLGAGWWFLEASGLRLGVPVSSWMPMRLSVAVLLLYVPFFAGSVLYIPPARWLLSQPFGEGLFWLPIALAERGGPQMLLGGVLAAGSAVANVRPYFCAEVLTFSQGMLAALTLIGLSAFLGYRWETAPLETWLRFFLWYQVALSWLGKAIPDKELPAQLSYWRRLNGSAPVAVALLFFALALTAWTGVR
ncbi:MAG: hypothetical protein KatS3mg115_1804 [Candidatus Poribacteria bacterium]|nr:MAG: hypothetical protein KatS3mg115_1804 [Candidatus Poribacteria bacterium]